jgi:hypothetical protein
VQVRLEYRTRFRARINPQPFEVPSVCFSVAGDPEMRGKIRGPVYGAVRDAVEGSVYDSLLRYSRSVSEKARPVVYALLKNSVRTPVREPVGNSVQERMKR